MKMKNAGKRNYWTARQTSYANHLCTSASAGHNAKLRVWEARDEVIKEDNIGGAARLCNEIEFHTMHEIQLENVLRTETNCDPITIVYK